MDNSLITCRNMLSAAASFYKATLSVTTGLSAPFNNLAIIYKQQVEASFLALSVWWRCFGPQHLYSDIHYPFSQAQGNYADAISCYNEVLRIDPLAADGLVNRGNTYKEIGRVNEAIQDYVRAINIRPAMAEAHANLASAYKDRFIVAIIEGAMESFCWVYNYVSAYIYASWLKVPILKLFSGHVEAALKSYKQALVLRPDFPEATCNLLHTLQVCRNIKCFITRSAWFL